MVLAKYGENTELDEDANGNTIIRNTATGTEVLLADFVDIVGSFGSASNRVDGESFFDQVNANQIDAGSVNTVDLSIGESSAQIHLSSNQPFSSNELTQIAFDAVTDDDDWGGFDSANNRYVIQTAGSYLIYCQVRIDGVSQGDSIELQMKVDGGTKSHTEEVASSTRGHASGQYVRKLNAGQTITASSRNRDAAGEFEAGSEFTHLSIVRIG